MGDNPFDPSHELGEGGPLFEDGLAEPSTEAGLGFTVAGTPGEATPL